MNTNTATNPTAHDTKNEEDTKQQNNEQTNIISSTSIVLTPPDTSQRSNLSNPSLNSLDSVMSSSINDLNNNYSSLSSNNLYLNCCSSPMYHSITSIASEDDPWRASSIGIKCISYKPVGYVFLTRRVLDLYSTDGKRKVDIVYNYSKKYRNRIKTPSIGSSMNNCSFCDTITIDFDPCSTLFDLIMEVQIITQGKRLFESFLILPRVKF